jgi:hypothetical protein
MCLDIPTAGKLVAGIGGLPLYAPLGIMAVLYYLD